VILAEFNEITWRILGPFCDRGTLPTFLEFVREGCRGEPIADETPPDLDPWISWMTVHTGRPRSEHGVKFLEQPPETVTGPRLADLVMESGRPVGIYGSIMHWPPRPQRRGFWVPSTFAPGPETEPADLRPIQDLNLGHTRAHSPTASRRRGELLRTGLGLMRLGLKPTTAIRVMGSVLKWKVRPRRAWERVGLQPLINLDFFEELYRQHWPHFATFHTNHAAHYMHRYWRAMDPSPFLRPPSEAEVRDNGPAIEYGYRVADRVLRRLWSLADDNTVLVLASGLGQQPYVTEEFPDGRKVIRIKSIEALLKLCDLEGHATAVSMMAPQWNLRVKEPAHRAHAEAVLRGAWAGEPGRRLYAFETIGDTINVNVSQKDLQSLPLDTPCGFPEAEGRRFRLGELCVMQDATAKQGYHDRPGVMLLRGPGIRRGVQLDACTNLDLAPTILHLLGIPTPTHMKGRVLEEALEPEHATVQVPA
jgi:hypothetical protein